MGAIVKRLEANSPPVRWWGKAILSTVLLISTVLIIARIVLTTAWMAGIVEARIEAASPAGQTIEIDGLHGDLIGALTIDGLTVSDADGVWLTAQDAKLNWSPLKILFGDIDIDNLSARLVDVKRRPLIVTSENSGGGITIDTIALRNLDFPQILLSDPIVPEAMALRARGSLMHGSNGGALVLDARTLGDIAKDSADIDLQWSGKNLLTGQAQIISAPDGLISTLLRTGSADLLTLDIETSGQAENLSTVITGRLGAREVLGGNIEKTGEQAALRLNFAAQYIPILKPYADFLGGDLLVTAKLDSLSKDAKVQSEISAPNLNIFVIGQAADNGFTFSELSADIASPLSLVKDAPVTIGRVKFSGRGSFGDPSLLSGQVQASDIVYGENRLTTLAGPIDINVDGDMLNIDTDLTGLAAQSGAFADSARRAVTVKLDAAYNIKSQSVDIVSSDIRLPGLTLSAKGRADIAKRSGDISGRFNVKKSGLIADIPADLSGTFSTFGARGGTGLRVQGQASNPDALPEPLAQLLTNTAGFESDIIFAKDKSIKFNKARITSEKLTATASGIYETGGNMAADFTFDAQAFMMNNLDISNLQGAGKVSGTSDNLKFDIEAQSREIIVSGQTLNDVNVIADGTYKVGALDAQIDLDAQNARGVLSAKTRVSYTKGSWNVADLDGALGDLRFEGNINGQGGDLAALTADFNVSGDPSGFIPAQNVTAYVKLTDSRADMSGEIEGLTAGPLEGGALSFTAKGPRDAVDFDMKLTGSTQIADVQRELTLNAQGQANLLGPDLSVEANVKAELGRYIFETNSPLRVSQTQDGLSANGDISGLRGDVKFDLSGADETLSLSGTSIALADVLTLAGRAALEGRLNFDGKFAAAASGLEGQIGARITGVKQPGSDVPPLEVSIDGAIIDGQLDLKAISESGELDGRAALSGPVQTFARPPFMTWPPAQPLQGKASASGNIGALAELFMPPETDMKGDVNLDLNFSLPLDAAGMDGTLSMTGGSFEQGTIGFHLKDMAFSADLNETSITVSRFSASGAGGGSLSGGGRMGLGSDKGSALDLTAKNLKVFDRREGFATMSGDLKFSHDNNKLTLTGDLVAEDASLSIDKLPSAGRPTLDVNFEGEEDDNKTDDVKTVTALDITLTSPGRIALRGRGVNASMGLDMKITGSFTDPIITGEAEIVRGRFDFIGKRFEFGDSKVVFQTPVTNSQLDISAVRETSDLTATVRITGTVNRPEIDLSAEPDLPEDEVLSRILFGRSAAQLTAIETARLAAALAQLSGGGGFDLMGNLENALGLDTLDFSQSESGAAQITTGKYLADDVYVEVRSSAEGTPGLAVEWTPRKNIEIEAETTPGESQRLSIKWKKDFD
ncbi:translocation/assembly module TamB domain-containing protein [Robiginitomaculum antarcticum]|uniref:translocation/assembly module TamB domain-containing protein n=1 Tax=Robiginitomaculum antarcticum TaxID=437507 RepID=UPI00035CA88D|nr:translocation/assembly module TamB domain-containing protein [Robiginitomaculum antarcticum]